jgi:putative two-component system response regulator
MITPASLEKTMPPKGTILIVEDELGPREAIRLILKPFYELRSASTGEDALKIIQNETVDLVTLDLCMPGLSGFDLLKQIKKIKPDLEVIVITALAAMPNAQKAIRYGASDFLSKPFHVGEVLCTVRKSFERINYNSKIRDLAPKTEDPRINGRRNE